METLILKNNFQVIYEKPSNVIPIAAIYLYIRQGSVNENDGIRGGSHLIEHMCFKGTKEIPNQKVLSTKFDEIGAYFNAFTTKYMTCYTVKCGEFFVKNCLHIISDMVLNSRFSKSDFEKEQNIVKEETIKNESNENIRVGKIIDSLLYEGSCLSYPIDDISYHDHVFEYNSISQLYKSSYCVENMVLSIVTHIPFSEIKKMLKYTFFTKYPKKHAESTFISLPSIILSPQSEIRYHIRKTEVENSIYMAIGFRTCDIYSKDMFPLQILSNVLAGTMSGRLFILLREKNAVTYSSSVDINNYSFTGDFTIQTSADYNKIIKNGSKPGVLPLIIGELNHLIKNGITEKELHIAKGYMKGSSVINMENCENQAQYNGEYVIMEKYNKTPGSIKYVKYSQIYDQFIHPVKMSDIKRVIKTYFIKSNMSVALCGKHVPSLEKVKSICNKLL